jgi:hypothetical protein
MTHVPSPNTMQFLITIWSIKQKQWILMNNRKTLSGEKWRAVIQLNLWKFNLKLQEYWTEKIKLEFLHNL